MCILIPSQKIVWSRIHHDLDGDRFAPNHNTQADMKRCLVTSKSRLMFSLRLHIWLSGLEVTVTALEAGAICSYSNASGIIKIVIPIKPTDVATNEQSFLSCGLSLYNADVGWIF